MREGESAHARQQKGGQDASKVSDGIREKKSACDGKEEGGRRGGLEVGRVAREQGTERARARSAQGRSEGVCVYLWRDARVGLCIC